MFVFIRIYSTLDLFRLRKRRTRILRYVGLDEDGAGLGLDDNAEPRTVSFAALRNRLSHFMLFLRCSYFHEGREWVSSSCQVRSNSGLRILKVIALRETRAPEVVLKKLVAVDEVSFAYSDIMQWCLDALNLTTISFETLRTAVPRTSENKMRSIAFQFQSALIACLMVFTSALRAKQMALWRLLAVSRYYDFVAQVHVDAKSGRLRKSRHEIPVELIDAWYLFLDVVRQFLLSPLSVVGADERIFRARNGSPAQRQYITRCVAQAASKFPHRVGPTIHIQMIRTVQATMAHVQGRDPSLNRALADSHNHSTSIASSSYVRLPNGKGGYLQPAAQQAEEAERGESTVGSFFRSLRK